LRISTSAVESETLEAAVSMLRLGWSKHRDHSPAAVPVRREVPADGPWIRLDDEAPRSRGYGTRSEAIRDLIRERERP
jgi:hypothetical protein